MFAEWIDFMAESAGHGGCFLTSVASEYDGCPGPIRDAVLTALDSWSSYVTAELNAAVQAGGLPADTDIDQLGFELNGVVLATDQAVQLRHDPEAVARVLRA